MPGDNGSATLLRPDQMAPHSVEAEEAAVGAILINPDDWYRVAAKLNPEDFFIQRNGWVWKTIQRLVAKGLAVDYVTVVEDLKAQNLIEEIGGAAYVTYLINHTPSSLYAETYAEIVRRAAIRRRLLNAASQIARAAHEEDNDINDVIDLAETALFDVTRQARPANVASALQVADVVHDEVTTAYEKHLRGEMIGVPTGFIDLDNLLGGLQKSDLIIVAGRPGMGKTSWLLSVMLYAVRAKVPSALFSLEMNKTQIQQRFVSMDTDLSTHTLRTGAFANEAEYARFVEANGRLGELPFWVDDTPAHNIMALTSQAKRLHYEHGLGLILVDYLQLATAPASKNTNRTQEVGVISRGLKQLARELNVPVIAASQLSRACEDRKDKRPILPDLRESGDIEQDSDIVLFLYRDVEYNPKTDKPNIAELRVAKHRNGPTGKVDLYFRKETTQFKNATIHQIDLRGY